MGRKKKIKPNETENTEIQNDGKTESTQSETSSGIPENVGGASEEIEKEVNEGLLEFSDEPETFEPVISSSEVKNDPDIDKPRKRGPKKKTDKEKYAMKVPGKLFLGMCDRVIVGGISFIDGMVSKNPIPKEYLHLDKETLEDEELIILAEAAIKEMKLEDKPIPVFFGTLAGLYITQYMGIKQLIAAEMKKYAAEQAAQKPHVNFGTPESNLETK